MTAHDITLLYETQPWYNGVEPRRVLLLTVAGPRRQMCQEMYTGGYDAIIHFPHLEIYIIVNH